MKRIFVFIALFVFGSGFAHAESFFENFCDVYYIPYEL